LYASPKKNRINKRLIGSPFENGDMKEKLLTYQHVQYYSGFNLKNDNTDDEDDDDSMFGSFNPNLNTNHGSYNKVSSFRRGTSYETLSRFTNKTGSYKGLLMLEKAPDEQLINQGISHKSVPIIQHIENRK
jgi:hypothetical protein